VQLIVSRKPDGEGQLGDFSGTLDLDLDLENGGPVRLTHEYTPSLIYIFLTNMLNFFFLAAKPWGIFWASQRTATTRQIRWPPPRYFFYERIGHHNDSHPVPQETRGAA
jgi:hypothetical protein